MNTKTNNIEPQKPRRQNHLRLIKTTDSPQLACDVSPTQSPKGRMELINQLERLAKSIEDDIALILRT